MFQKQFIFLFAFTLLLACGEAKTDTSTLQNEINIDVPSTATTTVAETTSPTIITHGLEENNTTPTVKEKVQTKASAKKETIQASIEKKPSPTIQSETITPKKETTPSKEEALAPTKHVLSHSNWNALLQKYVTANGKVNYKGFKADNAKLQAYLDHLTTNPVQKDWSRNKKMAYWINAYNAFTIKLIVDNYPISSITKINGGKPWDKKWIKLGGKTYSLNQIENDILRPKYKDARIHFAVNCAAKSCPTILNSAWTADNLNANLEKQAKKFINNTSFNTISAKKVKISKIFEWYAVDFGDNIIDYLNKYSTVKINADAKVEYMEYNWKLNK